MQNFIVFTDGSFHIPGETHGGIVFWGPDNKPSNALHVYSNNFAFTEMRNVGGEVIAAWCAMLSVAETVKKLNEESMDSYTLNLIYDYEGIGKWATGRWKANKPATKAYVKFVRDLAIEVPNLKINYIWIRGHQSSDSDNFVIGNNEADKVSAYDMKYAENHNIPICNIDEVIKW